LGHRRLAILDLSPAGHQPMLSADGQVGLVFNGCIYNFVELRRELEQLGHRFHSNCDTEVLLQAYRQWPIDEMVPKLRGMFAFAVWDEPQRKLTLVRDRMGVKPLVYRVGPDETIAFASTAGALRAAGLASEVNPQAVLEFLEYGFVTDNYSIYQGVQKLPPSSILEWRDGRVTQRTYWKLPEIEERSDIRFEEAVEETERLIMESVRLRLQADVPVGALLSGGIDSTLVCWAMAKLNANVKAFTVGTPGDESDESGDARETARRLGVDHETVNFPEHEENPLEELVNAYSEPMGSSSALGILHVSEAMREKVTVLLTGDGGDDVYLGYPFFMNAWRAEQVARKIPSFSAALWKGARPAMNLGGAWRRVRSFGDCVTGGLGAYARLHDGLPYLEENGILGPRLDGGRLAQREMVASFESARRLLGDVVAWHWKLHFTGEFMSKVDGGTTYWSLESRAPLLDHQIWEFAARLPAEVRFQGGQLKAVLREIVRRRVGDDVATRRKQGFVVPVTRWLADRWRDELKRLKGESRLAAEGWVRRAGLSAAIDAALEKREVPVQLWHLLVLEHWLERERAVAPAVELGAAQPLLRP
jgi:asparagine synthase (glutamine-hydrolysing)